jgi:hypothetical protein
MVDSIITGREEYPLFVATGMANASHGQFVVQALYKLFVVPVYPMQETVGYTPHIIFPVYHQKGNIGIHYLHEIVFRLLVSEDAVARSNMERSRNIPDKTPKVPGVRYILIPETRGVSFIFMAVKALQVVIQQNPDKAVVVLAYIYDPIITEPSFGRESPKTICLLGIGRYACKP